jgi:serine/threonine-protein kinase HipA
MAKCPLLLRGGAGPQQDTLAFALTQLAVWPMAATDGHAKNHSIFVQPGDSCVMTPLCDILSIWPQFGKGPNQFNRRKAGLAMAMRAKSVHCAFDTIHTRHRHPPATKIGGPEGWGAMPGRVEPAGPALAAVPARWLTNFHGRSWEATSNRMKGEAGRFLSGLESL